MLYPGRFHLNGYATGVYSSRRIEAATYESVAFRYIAATTQPAFSPPSSLSDLADDYLLNLSSK